MATKISRMMTFMILYDIYAYNRFSVEIAAISIIIIDF